MPAAKEKKTKVTASAPVENKEHILYINSKCGIRKFFTRKIHHLWDNKYRVNYHSVLDEEHKIVDSYFIEVPEPDVKEQTGKNKVGKA